MTRVGLTAHPHGCLCSGLAQLWSALSLTGQWEGKPCRLRVDAVHASLTSAAIDSRAFLRSQAAAPPCTDRGGGVDGRWQGGGAGGAAPCAATPASRTNSCTAGAAAAAARRGPSTRAARGSS